MRLFIIVLSLLVFGVAGDSDVDSETDRPCDPEYPPVALALIKMVEEDEARGSGQPTPTATSNATANPDSDKTVDEWRHFGNHVGSFLERLADNKIKRKLCIEIEKLMMQYENN
ncbi:hypothetical protein Ddc_11863 [Ditylenchus destructor]|nr:hypothetical protein Ddc_11863 [Ditylenchus destructor]